MKFSAKDLKVIYCDRQVIAVDKPCDLVTQGDDSLEVVVKEWICQEESREKAFLHPIHRLDKPVSGIVVFARTSKALSRLNESVREKKTEKVYTAKVEGSPPKEGTLIHYLTHDSFHAKVFDKPNKEAKKAVLHYRVIEGSTLEVTLETGRYHQIRAQLAHIGHPIVGDTKYGGEKSSVFYLHHTKFSIPHPVSKELLTFESQPSW